MKTRYLAYLTLVAGWLVFCYWLYAKELYPRFHGQEGDTWYVVQKKLDIPLAFTWQSDLPIAGNDFETWIDSLYQIDSSKNILLLQGFYFRDEGASVEQGEELAKRRVDQLIHNLHLHRQKTVIEIKRGEVSSDVRKNPFRAIRFFEIPLEVLGRFPLDTAEICFPVADSLTLPGILWTNIENWVSDGIEQGKGTLYLTGIADGTGIAESSDIAMERAMVVRDYLLGKGLNPRDIIISAGQRSLPDKIRNRCVMIYFDSGI